MMNLIAASVAATTVTASSPFQWLSYFTPAGLLEAANFAFPASNSCHSVADRNKAKVEDFFSLVASDDHYVDKDFTADSRSLYWRDMGETSPGPLGN